MYCRNCGQQVNSENKICTKCGFKSDYGDKFCSHCGKEVLPGQVLCVNCGFMIENERVAPHTQKATANKEKAYQKYTESVKKQNKISLIGLICTMVVILSCIFLPIFKCEYTPDSLNEIENWDEFGELMAKGTIEKNFSAFEDLSMILKQIFEDGASGEEIFDAFMSGIVLVLGLIVAVTTFITGISLIRQALNNISNPSAATISLYAEMNKSGGKENAFKKNANPIGYLIFVGFDILFAKTMGTDDLTHAAERNMSNLSGVSFWIVLIAIALVGYIVCDVLQKREEKVMQQQIIAEEFDR